MYLRAKKRRGHDYYSVVEGIRCADNVKQKIILNIGRLDNLTPEEIKEIEQKINELNDTQLTDKFWKIIFQMGYSIQDLVNIRRSLHYGDVATLYKIAEMIDLPNIISNEIPKGGGPNIGKIIVIMSICQTLAPTSKRDLKNWYEETALEYISGIRPEQTEEWNLYSAMKYLTKERIERIEHLTVLNLVERFNITLDTCLYDLTSTFFHGHKDMFKLHGYSRDHMGHLIQVVIGLAVTREDGLPIKHWVHPGNTTDVKALPGAAANMKQLYGHDHGITLVFDRGNLSEENIKVLDGMEYDYICGLKRNMLVVKDVIRKALDGSNFEHIKTIKDDDCNETSVIGTLFSVELWGKLRNVVVVYSEALAEAEKRSRTTSIQQAELDIIDLKKKCNEKNVSHDKLVVMLHDILEGTAKYFQIDIVDEPSRTELFIDKIEKANEMDQRVFRWIDPKLEDLRSSVSEMSIEDARDMLKGILGNKKKYYRYRLIKTPQHSDFTWKLKDVVLEKNGEFDGYYVLMSTDMSHSMKDIIEINDSRDIAEKAFQTLKNPLRIRPIRHWVPEMVRAHIYICVLGYLLRQMLSLYLKRGGMNISIRDSLIQLRRVKLVQLCGFKNSSCDKLTHLSSDQKKLFDVLELGHSFKEKSI